MAFKALPRSERGPGSFGPRRASPTIAVYGKNPQTTLCIPRELLRQAGLDDFPGSRLDILKGEGPDAGKIAVVEGEEFTISAPGGSKSPKSVIVRTSRLGGRQHYKARVCEYEIARRQLTITIPADFPQSDVLQLGAAA